MDEPQPENKSPAWERTTQSLRPDVLAAIDRFCATHGYDKREVIDVALRDYLKLPEPQ